MYMKCDAWRMHICDYTLVNQAWLTVAELPATVTARTQLAHARIAQAVMVAT
jgi:hypothetical protein